MDEIQATSRANSWRSLDLLGHITGQALIMLLVADEHRAAPSIVSTWDLVAPFMANIALDMHPPAASLTLSPLHFSCVDPMPTSR